jgi:hypothetical protein
MIFSENRFPLFRIMLYPHERGLHLDLQYPPDRVSRNAVLLTSTATTPLVPKNEWVDPVLRRLGSRQAWIWASSAGMI